ncbi:MAG: AraC family transcriptional regulator [Oscillospiraceae bacterium]
MSVLYAVKSIKYNGTEKVGFALDRPKGAETFLFLHFKTCVKFTLHNEVIEVFPHTCIILSPDTAHKIEVTECELVHDWVHFIPGDAENFINFGLPLDTLFYPSSTQFITSIFKECEEELLNREAYWKEMASNMLESVFITLRRQLLLEETHGNDSYVLEHISNFKKLRLKIYSDVEKDLDIEEMAAEVSLSRSRFSILYKKIFNVSPKQDLINARIERGKHLLLSSKMTVEQIAEMCGYTNVYHFIRQFKKVSGVSPGAYRGKL